MLVTRMDYLKSQKLLREPFLLGINVIYILQFSFLTVAETKYLGLIIFYVHTSNWHKYSKPNGSIKFSCKGKNLLSVEIKGDVIEDIRRSFEMTK